MAKLQTTHQHMLQTLEPLTDEDILKPYSAYSPEGSARPDPVINWIIGNTYEHFNEHLAYIQQQLSSD
jgi:hypothetical protein